MHVEELVRRSQTVADEIGGHRPGGAAGRYVLSHTAVVPGAAFGSIGVEHIDELGSDLAQHRRKVCDGDVTGREALRCDREQEIREAGTHDLAGQVLTQLLDPQAEGGGEAPCHALWEWRRQSGRTLIHLGPDDAVAPCNCRYA